MLAKTYQPRKQDVGVDALDGMKRCLRVVGKDDGGYKRKCNPPQGIMFVSVDLGYVAFSLQRARKKQGAKNVVCEMDVFLTHCEHVRLTP